jgi:hypothetical protein
MTARSLPSIDELKKLFRYDPETGKLFWERRPHLPQWSGKYAGKEIKTLDDNGYIRIRLQPRYLKAHRVCWLIYYGTWPDGLVDHKNGIHSDNRIRNLRLADNSQNGHNRHVAPTGKYGKGVTLHAASGRFRAYTVVRGKQISFGYYNTQKEAVEAYLLNAPKHHGDFYNEASQ